MPYHLTDSTLLKGKVALIGAGPGDPELITLKAVRYLAMADIVLKDKLANQQIIDRHAPHAQVISVGKEGGKKESTSQSAINELMVELALKGHYVARLKGGDSGIFSNIDDELKALMAAGIEVEVVPGISAAQGVSAVLGMPLTARGLSQGIRFLTFYQENSFTEETWQNLAATNDTLVFYMSSKNCFQLCQKLIESGKAENTPMLLAENATNLNERYRISTIGASKVDWANEPIQTPALLVIGEVAGNANIPEKNDVPQLVFSDTELWGTQNLNFFLKGTEVLRS